MYPLLRIAANVAVRTLPKAPDQELSDSVAYWVDAQLGDKSDPLAKRVRVLLAMHLARELLSSWDATDVSVEDAAWVVDEVTATLRGQGTREATPEFARDVLEVLSRARVPSTASLLHQVVAFALGASGGVADHALAVCRYLEPRRNVADWRRAWWTTWFTETLDRVYRDAVTTLASECLLSTYFCATRNHVIAPDIDMHIALEDNALHLLALGTQFDLIRPARIKKYLSPAPIQVSPAFMIGLQRDSKIDALPITLDLNADWQMRRPVPAQAMARTRWFARRPRRDPSVHASALVAGHPHNRTITRPEVRSGVLNAKGEGLMIARLVVQLDVGEKRPLQLTIFGHREMWAALWILRRWLGDALAVNAAWSTRAWGFVGLENRL
jgi:hypothetical protein